MHNLLLGLDEISEEFEDLFHKYSTDERIATERLVRLRILLTDMMTKTIDYNNSLHGIQQTSINLSVIREEIDKLKQRIKSCVHAAMCRSKDYCFSYPMVESIFSDVIGFNGDLEQMIYMIDLSIAHNENLNSN